MVQNFFNEFNIELNVNAVDWEDATRKAGEILLRNGCITNEYIAAMIKSAKELGPYIVIASGLAMPHARPENGVIKTGFSLMILDTPINYGHSDNDPVWIVIAMACSDNSSHIQMLKAIATIFEQPEAIEELKSAENKKDVMKIIRSRLEHQKVNS